MATGGGNQGGALHGPPQSRGQRPAPAQGVDIVGGAQPGGGLQLVVQRRSQPLRRIVQPAPVDGETLAGIDDPAAGAEVAGAVGDGAVDRHRSEEHTSELQSLMRISYAVFCLKKKNKEI